MQLRTIISRYVPAEDLDEATLATFRLLIRRIRSVPAALRSNHEHALYSNGRNAWSRSQRRARTRRLLNHHIAAILHVNPIPFKES